MIIHWSFEPVIFSLGRLHIRWYGLLFVGAFLVGQSILARIFAAEGVPKQRAESLLLSALLGAVIGARLAHCLLYDPHHYLANPVAILRVWEGGLASHGGVAGVLLGLWLASRRQPRLPFVWLIDRAAIPAALGASFIRVANFLNSEIVGIPTSGSWGVVFASVDQIPRHPVQLYEAIAYALIACLLWIMYRRLGGRTPQGLLFGWLLILAFTARLILEEWKVSQAAYDESQFLSVGQLLSIPLIVVGVASLWWSRRHQLKEPA